MPGAEHVIEYHIVTQGECWAAIVGEPPVKIRRGDIIMLPQGDAHVISSAPDMRADANVAWYHEMKEHQRPFRVAYADRRPPAAQSNARGFDTLDGEQAALVCGFIGCDMRPFNPLISMLPRLLHLTGRGTDSWSQQFIQLAATESGSPRPGSEVLLERLSEMMFVDAVRSYTDTLPVTSTGWLAGLRDRFVGRALALLHERPAAAWSIDELGRQVGLSRSALHERFVELIGLPPMQYLAHWRMQVAARLLRDTQASVSSIALEVGYDSEAAFARAFKRLVGTPPGSWRRASSARNLVAVAPAAESPVASA
jgi:AraC-like DNA-binding protein